MPARRAVGSRRAAEIGMQHHAREVDHRAQPQLGQRVYALRDDRPQPSAGASPPLARARRAPHARRAPPRARLGRERGVTSGRARRASTAGSRRRGSFMGSCPCARACNPRGVLVVSFAAGFGHRHREHRPRRSALAPFKVSDGAADARADLVLLPGLSGTLTTRTRILSVGTGRCLQQVGALEPYRPHPGSPERPGPSRPSAPRPRGGTGWGAFVVSTGGARARRSAACLSESCTRALAARVPSRRRRRRDAHHRHRGVVHRAAEIRAPALVSSRVRPIECGAGTRAAGRVSPTSAPCGSRGPG